MLRLQAFSIKSRTPRIVNNLKSTKKQIILPSITNHKTLNTAGATALASALSADAFIKKTSASKIEPYSPPDFYYEQRGSEWYEIHVPSDGSGYKHEIPCRNPYEKVYYPSS